MCEDEDYLPEFGTLMVLDDGAHAEDGPFSRQDSTVQPCGTIIRSGHGWLEGAAGDGPHVVRMAVHDSVPEDDVTEWEDVVELPYRSLSGRIGLGYVTGGFAGHVFSLPGAGSYRVRATRRNLDDDELDDLWLLRFWFAEPGPPRWFARRAAAVPPPAPGWGGLFGFAVTDLLWAVGCQNGATVAALRQWGEEHGRGADWLAQPLPAPLPPEMDPADVARQIGVPAPTTPADLLDLFVVLGVLVDDGGYREPAVTPNPEDVLDLPGNRRDRLVAQREHNRFRAFAADLVSVAMWGGSEQTLAALAERTLATEADIAATLEWAMRGDLLHISGSLDETFTMTR